MLNHYLPRYYLKGFTESPTSQLVWIYERNTNNVFRAPVAKVACQHGFYSDSDEEYLANQIEGPANPVIQKVRERQDISAEDKILLSRYLSVMWRRVPDYRERGEAIAPRVADSVCDDFAEQLEMLRVQKPMNADVLDARRAELEELRAKYKVALPAAFKREMQRPLLSERIARVLCDMTWYFLTADEGSRFIAGDNPLFYFESLGMRREHSEISVPISSSVLLWATWRTALADVFLVAPPQIVREMNRRTAWVATRYLFHCKHEYWVQALGNKTDYDLHRLP